MSVPLKCTTFFPKTTAFAADNDRTGPLLKLHNKFL